MDYLALQLPLWVRRNATGPENILYSLKEWRHMESTREDLARHYKVLADRVRMNALDVLTEEVERKAPKAAISRQDLEDLWAVGAVLAGIREGRL